MTRLVAIAVLAVGGVAAMAPRAEACSCLARSEAEQLEAHDLVFEGTVATVTPGADDMERATFTIERILKGAADATTVIEYGTSTAACGLGHLEIGTRMRIYAATTDDGSLQANLCGGSMRLDLPPVPTGDPADHPLPAATHKRGCGGCASGGDGALAWVIVVGAVLFGRRRRPSRRA